MKLLRWMCVFASLLAAQDWGAQFKNPPAEHGMGVYWWWFGPAVTRDEAARELEVMRRAGISYVLIFPLYPISASDPSRGIRNFSYLSPEFLDRLAYTTSKAKAMGFTVDLLLGTGWPYGGPSIGPDLGAKRLRVVSEFAPGKAPALEANETLISSWLVRGDGKRVDLASAIDVTTRPDSMPNVAGNWTRMSFIQSPTKMQVKRPALGAEGLVMDHLSSKALQTYLHAVGEKLLSAIPAGTLRAIHSDSMEVYGQEWTDDFLAEFAERRGYDLKPYLPALVADAGPLTADVRHDFWRTAGELAIDNYVHPLREWARSRGVGLQAESYGTPPVDMRSYGEVDYPMGESYDWKMFVASRWASSAAHQLGKRETSAEAYTWLRSPRYVSTLQDIKLGSDLHFICGVNKMIAHGFAYSPPAAGIPGWGYYAPVMLNDNNPFWPYFRLLSDYVRRVSYALTRGKPAVDVALYLPEDDVMAETPAGNGLNLYMTTKYRLADGKSVPEFGLPAAYESESPVIKTLMTAGYTFDGIDRNILRPELKTSRGRIEIGDVAYRIAVLPNLRGISLAVLERLAEFCRTGGTLIATRRLPEAAYGVRSRDQRYARVRTLTKELFGAGPADQARRRAYGRGVAIYVPDEDTEFARALASLGPEIRFEAPDADLVFLHRGEGAAHLYFLANTSTKPKSLKPSFRDGSGAPQIWDPMTGEISRAVGTDITIELEPFGSAIILFDGGQAKALPRTVRRVATGRRYAAGGPFLLRRPGAEVRLDALKSWTELPAWRYYSGRGDYEFEIEVPADSMRHGRGVWLDLGDVREIADVAVNGRPAGVAWKLPYRVDITREVRPGKNRVTVGVTNLLINRVLGQPVPDYKAIEPIRFPAPTEKKLVPHPLQSGLLGPVQVVMYEQK